MIISQNYGKSKDGSPPLIIRGGWGVIHKEREIWYIYFGTNIGFELDGKEDFLRPCLIIKKISNETFYALPLTSKLKEGSWYSPSSMNRKEGRYILSQMRVIDAKRLKYFVETINEQEFVKVKSNFIEFFTT